MLAILYATGLRRSELERLDLEDWDRDNGILSIDGRKTGHARRVPVGEGAWRCIEAYLPHRHNLLEKAVNDVNYSCQSTTTIPAGCRGLG